MSSFIGHSLAAAALFSAAPPRRHSAFSRATWCGWLVVLASAPDIDYLIPALGSPEHQGSRITHSLAFSLILPLCTVGALYLTMRPESRRRRLSACAVLAGLSHTALQPAHARVVCQQMRASMVRVLLLAGAYRPSVSRSNLDISFYVEYSRARFGPDSYADGKDIRQPHVIISSLW